MADTTNVSILSAIATTASKLPDIAIKNGQLIFVQDKQKIALDFNDKRKFYNQIVILETESERQGLVAPVSGLFYFVVGSAVLWTYQEVWIQITKPPEEVIFIGATLPELGSENVLYINKANKSISVWDAESQLYLVVADETKETKSISNEEIDSLFQN